MSGDRIDVHHHLVPPEYASAVRAHRTLEGPIGRWTPEASLSEMDRAGVATAILSISNPGLFFGDAAEARRLARICNEYGAELKRRHRGRFGMFAALPLPDVEGALAEIAYALDVLGLEGVGMFTSYGGEAWLGDDRFAPVFAELNRRRAVVFTHPVAIPCCANLIPFVSPRVIEFGTDTTRTIASYLFSGAAARYPDVRMIFSHAGGTMPFLIERFTEMATEPIVPLLSRFFYDTAQSSNRIALGALTQLVPVSQVLFGSDFPFRTETDHVANLAACGFSADEVSAIERTNALRLLSTASPTGTTMT